MTANAGGAFHDATCNTVPPSRGWGTESSAAIWDGFFWDVAVWRNAWRAGQEAVARE
eukprot:CAMPEP_0201971512 /NCGR_PEP_ID=MMETSP0904-20121228/37375_1 /ASSEMBLY_ACC=CAM_ASM_000553 /TAXON_ID=420261 /ORGANISM="Thalassiosira antarctica, Strain CCMP982" /LENGTH=56 /DNA_ID=CAMNT_0048520953 /DNA_START=23 /DNA_END=193 /DNA_ORIENTATION=-